MKRSTKHLSFETLVDLAQVKPGEGDLAAGARTELVTHLDGCDKCRAVYNDVQRMLSAMSSDKLEAAPAYAVARALQAFRPLAKPSPDRVAAGETGSSLRRVLAGLLRFDSRATAAFGLRSGNATPAARQVVYTMGEFDLDLRFEASAGGWLVAGQLLGSEATGMAALTGGEFNFSSDLNDLGEFSFAGVRPGLYQLLIFLPDVDLEIAALQVEG